MKVSAAGAVVIKNCVTVNVMVAAAVQISKYDMLDTLKNKFVIVTIAVYIAHSVYQLEVLYIARQIGYSVDCLGILPDCPRRRAMCWNFRLSRTLPRPAGSV